MIVDEPTYTCIADIETKPEADANARLIAAAPELLESLKATLAHAEEMTCELEDTDVLTEFPYIQRARALIAKAEGRA